MTEQGLTDAEQLEAARRRIAELEDQAAKAAEAQAAAGAGAEVGPPEPTHYLQLADGRTVDHAGAIPTHYSDENGTVPVAGAWER
jgi:hypothetical protein